MIHDYEKLAEVLKLAERVCESRKDGSIDGFAMVSANALAMLEDFVVNLCDEEDFRPDSADASGAYLAQPPTPEEEAERALQCARTGDEFLCPDDRKWYEQYKATHPVA